MKLLSCSLLLGLLFLPDCGREKKRSKLVPVHIMLGRSTSFLPVLLAQRLGLYEKEGLTVSVEDAPSTTKSTQALLGGSVDVAGGMYEQTLSTNAQGQTITSFVTLMHGDFRALVVSPGKTRRILRIEDLKGAVIGVSALGSPNEFLVASTVQRHGLSRADVSIVAVGTLTTAVLALERDRVDAAVLGGSGIDLYEKRHAGSRILVDTRTPEGTREAFGVDRFAASVLYSMPKWLAANRDTARKFAGATREGLQWIQAHSPEEIASNMPESLRTERDPDREAIKALKPNFSPDGLMSIELASAVKKAFTALPENRRAQNVDLSQTFTNEFLVSQQR